MKLKLNALEEQFKKDKETADQIFEEQRKVNKKSFIITTILTFSFLPIEL